MNLLPFENRSIDSHLSLADVKLSIEGNIALTTVFGIASSKNTSREYEGYIQQHSFKLRRVLKSGQNSFIPIVSGDITEHNDGSQIELKFRLHPYVYLIVVAMTLFSLFLVITSFSMIGVLMLFAPYVVSTVFYTIEMKVVKTKLSEMLKVDIQ